MPLLLGSVLIFAIDTAQVSSASEITSTVNFDSVQTVQNDSFTRLEDNEFWDKFRESVMKDKDKHKDNPDNSSGNHNEPPKHDINQSVHHSAPMYY